MKGDAPDLESAGARRPARTGPPRARLSPIPRALSGAWHRLELSRQFLLVSAMTIVAVIVVVGAWLVGRIEQTVTQNSAIDTALFVESFIGERVQSLGDDPTYDPQVQETLQRLMQETAIGRRIITFKVWAKGGRIIYASRPEHVGEVYEPTESLATAWNGTVAYEYQELSDAENKLEKQLDIPLLEIYVPVRQRFGGRVIAVVEFYEDATGLARDINRAAVEAGGLLSLIGASVVAALYGMAASASRTISRQRRSLNDRIAELSGLLDQNLTLRQKVEATSQRAAELNERYLRRIGSDLHDGPAQLVSLALFRLDASTDPGPAGAAPGDAAQGLAADEKGMIRRALVEALKEIRDISTGLSVPEVDRLPLTEVVREAVRSFEHRAGLRVMREIDPLPVSADALGHEAKIAAYRFVQEALSNAWRHAPGAPIRVTARREGQDRIVLAVSDEGPGFDPSVIVRQDRLGLAGLVHRLESIGGRLDIDTAPGKGTTLRAELPVRPGTGETA